MPSKKRQSIQEKFDRAQELQSQGNVAEAIAEFWTILELDKKHLATWHLLAQVLEKQGDFAGAIEAYRRAIELDPQPPFWVYRHFGFALNHEGLLDEAIVAYQKAIVVQPEDATTYSLLGQVQGKQDDLEGAIESYQKATELSSELPVWVYLNLGDGLRQKEQLEAAISAYEKALVLEPENAGIQRLLEVATKRKEANEGDRCHQAKQLQREGLLDEALAEFRSVLEVDGSNLVALHQVAQICETQGKWDEAVEGYRRAVEVDAEAPFWVYRHLGFALSQLGDLEGAVAAYEKAVELNPEDEATQSLLQHILNLKEELEELEVSRSPNWQSDKEIEQLEKEVLFLQQSLESLEKKYSILEVQNKLLSSKCFLLEDLDRVPQKRIESYLLIVKNDLFDVDYYYSFNPDVKKKGINPLLHYLENGHREGRKPNPLFDTEFYKKNYADKIGHANPLIHFLTIGANTQFNPCREFNIAFYLENNPDIQKNQLNPLTHYIRNGKNEDKKINHETKKQSLIKSSIHIPLKCLITPKKSNQNKRKILIYSHNLKLQGAPISLSTIVFGYLAKGMEPVILSSGVGYLQEEYEQLGIPIVKCSLNNEKYLPKEDYIQKLIETEELIKKHKVHAAHVNTLMGHHIVILCKKLNIPVLLNIRESVDPYSSFQHWSEYQQKMSREAYHFASDIVFVSEKTKNLWHSFERKVKPKVIYNSIIEEDYLYRVLDTQRDICRTRLGVHHHEKLLLSVGTVLERKGQKDLIDSLPKLDTLTKSSFKLIIIGGNESDYCKELEQTIQNFPDALRNRVTIIPETKSDEGKNLIAEHYLAADLFILNSRQESYPRVILEAMLFGLPIVTTPNFGVVEQVEEGKGAFFYTEGNSNELAKKIATLLNSEKMMREFSQFSRQRFEKINSYSRMIDSYTDILSSIQSN